jgi:mRNA interferase MazF
MARSLHVRLDDSSAAALQVVRAARMTDSEAVRTALREGAARRRVRSAIRDGVRRLAVDEGDREEMRLIREQMAEGSGGTRLMVRGEVFRLSARPGACGHEQRGARYAVAVQADECLGLGTTLVSPTSTAARPASFRPVIALDGRKKRVLVEQTTVVDSKRLGRSAGRLDADELRSVDEALALVLASDYAASSVKSADSHRSGRTV